MESIFEHAGGLPAIHRFVDVFYSSVLADPVLQPLFGAGRPEHVDHLTAFDAEQSASPDLTAVVAFRRMVRLSG